MEKTYITKKVRILLREEAFKLMKETWRKKVAEAVTDELKDDLLEIADTYQPYIELINDEIEHALNKAYPDSRHFIITYCPYDGICSSSGDFQDKKLFGIYKDGDTVLLNAENDEIVDENGVPMHEKWENNPISDSDNPIWKEICPTCQTHMNGKKICSNCGYNEDWSREEWKKSVNFGHDK